MADVGVRAASAADVDEIARIQVETWRHAYASLLPAEVLDAMTTEVARAAWAEAVSDPPSPQHRAALAVRYHGAPTPSLVRHAWRIS